MSPAPALTPEPEFCSCGPCLTLPVTFPGTGLNPGSWTQLPPVKGAQSWQPPTADVQMSTAHLWTCVHTCTAPSGTLACANTSMCVQTPSQAPVLNKRKHLCTPSHPDPHIHGSALLLLFPSDPAVPCQVCTGWGGRRCYACISHPRGQGGPFLVRWALRPRLRSPFREGSWPPPGAASAFQP